MSTKIVTLEDLPGPHNQELKKLMLLVPPKQRDDSDLTRLILFRLKLDGFEQTRAYLVEKLRAADGCSFNGRLYDYLKDDVQENECKEEGESGNSSI